MFRSFRVVLADDNNKKTLNDVNRLLSAWDLQMPEMGGFEVALRVHKFRSRSWPLIIALTASSEEQVWYLPTCGNGWSNKETCSPTWLSR
ncbi:hypothetical protein MTR67_047149 [Solanum verrucosum]|uniref:Uncharacterized protein n=1 Tax=Solanum verrucosum TaxID=315347 RepID=A0AAF0ZYQ1_SOLVR|nr:hypothetical protein MTR67_047149 [Solanum verrucosum]